MNKYIATWVYLDSAAEKSKYPNTGGDSTSPEFQAVYWRCIIVFFETSLKFHKDATHILFTNTTEVPIVDGLDLNDYFRKKGIQVVTLKNKYPLPENYFGSFRNQFFEFSIIDHLATFMEDADGLLLLDSDCVFTGSMDGAFAQLQQQPYAMTYVVDHEEEYTVHGVSGKDMRTLSNELGLSLTKNPYYSGGELLFAKGTFFKAVAADFPSLYDNMMQRHKAGKIKFNEEAHVLSYYYYKHPSKIGGMDGHIKRLWTNRNYYRNVSASDRELTIWHLPNEKRKGLDQLFALIVKDPEALNKMEGEAYRQLLFNTLLLASNHKWDYYKVFKNAVNKTLKKLKIISK
tara:strand:+ start:12704 stop:13738 length:1035 start_codon:yes stop_codon:yes gene_type:complete